MVYTKRMYTNIDGYELTPQHYLAFNHGVHNSMLDLPSNELNDKQMI